jgi:spermidine/putrescine transport system substrate-binding protein
MTFIAAPRLSPFNAKAQRPQRAQRNQNTASLCGLRALCVFASKKARRGPARTASAISRRSWLKTTAATAISTIGCSRLSKSGVSGQKLFVFNWSDYIDDAVIAEFESEHGCTVVYDNYASDAELETRLATGAGSSYDLVFPSDRAAAALLGKHLFQPLDRDRLPNVVHLEPAFLNLPFDKRNAYSVPYFWGTLALGLRTDQIAGRASDLAPLFDRANRGRITMLDDMENVVAAALGHLGLPLNSVEPAHLEAAERLLLEQKPLVQAYTSDAYRERLITGQAWASLGWSGDLLQAADALEQSTGRSAIDVIIPAGGTMLWVDSMMIPREARNVELAHAFINRLLDPAVAVQNALKVNYATPNRTARERLPAETLADARIYPPPETLARCTWLEDRGEHIERIEKVWRTIRS